MEFTLPSMAVLTGASTEAYNHQVREIALYAERYAWLRANPAFETEALLSGLTPEEFDALVDKARST